MTRRSLDLDTLILHAGSHEPDGQYCIMEAVAYIAGEPWTDAPACVCPVIAAFCRSWNDGMDDEVRQGLKPYIPRLVGTRTTFADEETRAWMALDWLVRVQAPAWLEVAGLTERAAILRALPPITAAEIAVAVQDVISVAQSEASAARDAARDAATAAAWDATWDVARDAATAAARDAATAAATDAATAAAWDATWDAAGDAAWDVARDAATAAATDAATAAAWDATWDAAGDAARDAARVKLRPTVEVLQRSAYDLLDRMIAVGQQVAA